MLSAIIEAVAAILKSRFGQISAAFLVAWVWSGMRTNASWQARISAEKAEIERQYQAEVTRQAQAAREIAEAATKRVEEELRTNAEMQAIINEYANAEKAHAIAPARPDGANNCLIDDDFSSVLRRLSAPANRSPQPARAPAKLRKAR